MAFASSVMPTSTRISVGSARMPSITERLDPMPPYALPESSPASTIANGPSVRMRPPPTMSPMSESGSGKSVSTGIRIGTVIMQVNATTGAHQ